MTGATPQKYHNNDISEWRKQTLKTYMEIKMIITGVYIYIFYLL